jgi:hypothetical protein
MLDGNKAKKEKRNQGGLGRVGGDGRCDLRFNILVLL